MNVYNVFCYSSWGFTTQLIAEGGHIVAKQVMNQLRYTRASPCTKTQECGAAGDNVALQGTEVKRLPPGAGNELLTFRKRVVFFSWRSTVVKSCAKKMVFDNFNGSMVLFNVFHGDSS